MSGKFALIVANTEYVDNSLAKLSAPGKDAEDFARVLKDQNICAFDDVRVVLNQPEHIVRRAIEVYFSERKPSDLVVFYFSGHGIRDELGALYLAVKNTVRSRLRSTAIKSDYVREIMDQSRSKRQVLILDCCNSGAFVRGTKSGVGGSMGISTAFGSPGSGCIILTASDATQFAWEGDQVIGETQNSLFTHFLVKGLEGAADEDGDGTITIDELYDYAYEQIVNRTPKQTPGKWSFKQQGEIVLRQSTQTEDIKPAPLPKELIAALDNMLPYVREGAIKQLGELLKSKNIGVARSARTTLEKIAIEDDSRYVASSAKKVLESADGVERAPINKEKGNNKSEAEAEAGELAKKKVAEDLLAQKKPEVIRIAQERELQQKKLQPVSAPATEKRSVPEWRRPPILWIVLIFSSLTLLLFATVILVSKGLPFSSRQNESPLVEQPTIPATTNPLISVPEILPPTSTNVVLSEPTEIILTPEPSPIPPTQVEDTPVPLPQPSGKIVFTCQKYGDNKDQICIMNADGSGQHQLTDDITSEHFYAELAPDGDSIVFSSNRSGDFEIYEMDLRGNIIPITNMDGDAYAPAISPDGNKIVFIYQPKNQNQRIWLVNRNGTDPHEIYSKLGYDAVDPVWSPDGQKILFALGADDYNKKLYTINKDGSNPQVVNEGFLTRGRSDWSPNGRWIASYALTDPSDPNWLIRDIFMMNSNGANVIQLTSGQNTLAPSFSPDNQWIAFMGYMDWGKNPNGCEIYIMRVDGTDIRRLTNNSYCDYQPRWGP